MAQYYSGIVQVPGDGTVVPVCRVSAGGCVVDDPAGMGSVFVGGPDVTTTTGLELDNNAQTFIPGAAVTNVPVVPADTEDRSLILYACAKAAATVTWLSTLPPPY